MASPGKAFGFSGLDEGWDFAEGTREHYTPLPHECEPPDFLPVICVVSSISQLRPEDLASFSKPNLAIATDTDEAMPTSDAWFQELSSTAVSNHSKASALQAETEHSVEFMSGNRKPRSKLRSIWKRFRAR